MLNAFERTTDVAAGSKQPEFRGDVTLVAGVEGIGTWVLLLCGYVGLGDGR